MPTLLTSPVPGLADAPPHPAAGDGPDPDSLGADARAVDPVWLAFVNTDDQRRGESGRRADVLLDFDEFVDWLQACDVLDAERASGIRRRAYQQPAGAAASLVDARRVRAALRALAERGRLDAQGAHRRAHRDQPRPRTQRRHAAPGGAARRRLRAHLRHGRRRVRGAHGADRRLGSRVAHRGRAAAGASLRRPALRRASFWTRPRTDGGAGATWPPAATARRPRGTEPSCTRS
jgi:hypothetical protein